MANDAGQGDKVRTCKARLSFPHLFTPRDYPRGSGEKKYSCTLLFPPGADLSALKKSAAKAAKSKWEKKPPNFRSPFRDGSEKDQEGYEEGWTFISCTSKKQPGIVDGKLRNIEYEDRELLYPGCWVKATIVPFAYDVSGNKGVSFGLRNMQLVSCPECGKVEQGSCETCAPLGGTSKASEDFDEEENWPSEEEDGGDDGFFDD